VKQAIFSMLEAKAYRHGFEAVTQPDGTVVFASAHAWPVVLDLYAGSGALGIEALSRGAQRVDFVDTSAAARRAIAENLFSTGLDERAHIYSMPARVALATLQGPYDLIFLDPPYQDPDFPEVFEHLSRSRLLRSNSTVVLEHSRVYTPSVANGRLQLQATRFHGGTAVSVYQVAHESTRNPHEGEQGV